MEGALGTDILIVALFPKNILWYHWQHSLLTVSFGCIVVVVLFGLVVGIVGCIVCCVVGCLVRLVVIGCIVVCFVAGCFIFSFVISLSVGSRLDKYGCRWKWHQQRTHKITISTNNELIKSPLAPTKNL